MPGFATKKMLTGSPPRDYMEENQISLESMELYFVFLIYIFRDYPSNWWHDRQTMAHWLNENLPSLVERITDDFVGSILRSPLPYIVDFVWSFKPYSESTNSILILFTVRAMVCMILQALLKTYN